jgi:D-amino peptidase
MRVYITSDLEGIAGVHLWAQTGGEGPAYAEARGWLTQSVNAAAVGALEAGADYVLVDDGHGGATNLLVSALHPRVDYVCGKPKPFWLAGLTDEFDASFFIGCHAMAGTRGAVLSHTMSGEIQNLWVNDMRMGEIGLWAAACGYYGVPCVLASGCDKACAEAASFVQGIETVASKKGLSQHCAVLRRPEDVIDEIRERAGSALAKAGQIQPFAVKPPVEMRIEFTSTAHADWTPLIPGRERLDGRTVTYRGRDFIEAFRLCFGLA